MTSMRRRSGSFSGSSNTALWTANPPHGLLRTSAPKSAKPGTGNSEPFSRAWNTRANHCNWEPVGLRWTHRNDGRGLRIETAEPFESMVNTIVECGQGFHSAIRGSVDELGSGPFSMRRSMPLECLHRRSVPLRCEPNPRQKCSLFSARMGIAMFPKRSRHSIRGCDSGRVAA